MRSLIAHTLIVLAPGAACAATLLVPTEFTTIQDAVDAASVGDTILVAPGIYTGDGNRDISFDGKDLVLQSEAGPERTILDVQGSEEDPHRAFLFNQTGESSAAQIVGFGIRNGWLADDSPGPCSPPKCGGAVYIRQSSPTFANCTIQDCHAHRGGAVYIDTSDATFTDCTFLGNTALTGGAFQMVEYSGVIHGCTLSDNEVAFDGGAIFAFFSLSPSIENSMFVRNRATLGGALYLEESYDTMFDKCLFIGNEATSQGGCAYLLYQSFISPLTFAGCTFSANTAATAGGALSLNFAEVVFEHSIIWGSCAPEDDEMFFNIFAPPVAARFTCCAVDGSGLSPGGDKEWIGPQVFEDPLFCAQEPCDPTPTGSGIYELQDVSPCLAENSPCGELIGALPQGCVATGTPEVSVSGFRLALAAIRPNPSYSAIRYVIEAPEVIDARIRLLDVSGRLVRELFQGELPVGHHERSAMLEDASGRQLPSGVYYLVAESSGGRAVRSFVITR